MKKKWTVENARPIVERFLMNEKLGKVLFDMYTSFGFPPELTIEELQDRGYGFDVNEVMEDFDKRFKEHQEKSRKANEKIFVSPLSLQH